MFIAVIVAFLLLSARISYKYKKNIQDCTALVFAGVILVMYVLAFCRGLRLMWAVAALVMIWSLVSTWHEKRDGLAVMLRRLLDVHVIMLVICTIAVGLATDSMVFTWWDDINYWSSDAKQLFFMNGFPGKYGNVSPEFGDYPPVTSLVKWLFLQAGGSSYRESLQFLGYFFTNAVFMMPLNGMAGECIDRLEISGMAKAFAKVITFVGAMLLPGIFNGIIYYGTPADITMAIVYGALLFAIYDRKDTDERYYYVRIALYTAVLLLTKSIGFEWAAFALAFYFVWAGFEKKVFLPVLFGGASLGSWLLFCLVNRRVAKLTGAGIKMATSGNYTAPENAPDKLGFFLRGFLFEPMHADHNLTLDLSTGAAVVLIFAAVFVLYKTKVVTGAESKKLALFLLISGLIAYTIVFVAHITIFQTEDQYLEPYAMAVSIARYCAPFTLGGTYLLMGICFDRSLGSQGAKAIAVSLAAAFLLIFLSADYTGVYKYLGGYRASVSENEAYFDDMVGEDGFKLAGALDDRELWGKRVLVLRDGHSYYWVHNTYISKEASPVALVYDSFLTEEDTRDTMVKKILDSHAAYFYVEDNEGIATELFKEVLGSEDFEPGRVIKIEGNVY